MLTYDPPSDRLGALARSVLEISRAPDDQYEVAAILESMGWTDQRAAEAFGATDLFDLAQQIWPLVSQSVSVQGIQAPPDVTFFQALYKNIRYFLRGIMFAAPTVVSVAAMLTLRFSLWSYQYFSVDMATSIALGTILSFSVTGGFMQAIARRGLMYVSQHQYSMARRMTFMFMRVGVVVSLVVGILILLVDLVFPVFPPRMLSIMIIYYAFLCAIWLSLTVFYMLQQEILFTLLVSIGIGLVWLFHEMYGMSIILAQITALTFVSILNIVLALYLFRREESKQDQSGTAEMPRLSIVAYTVLPYFTYGLLYFTFLFVDRVMAWSSHGVYMPYVIWFRGEYETGLDFAVLALVFPLGVVEMVMLRFSERLIAIQKAFTLDRSLEFNRRYVAIYRRSLISYTIISMISGAVTYAIVAALNSYKWFNGSVYMSSTTIFVFSWGVIAYVLLAAALLNCLVLFSLSLPMPVVQAVLKALLTNMFVGFVLSRLVHYSWAVLGMVVGSLTFVLLTSRETFKVLAKLDYHLYAAS